MIGLDLLLSRFKIYRQFRGGVWRRSTSKAPIGEGTWLRNYKPCVGEEFFKKMVNEGNFEEERYL